MFRRRDKTGAPKTGSGPADVYFGLRNRILTLDPATAGLAVPPGSAPWGCVMETGYANGTATLVCLSDGTTSVYTSSGGGIIGGGGHEAVVRANARLLAVLSDHKTEMSPSTEHPLPGVGRTIIRALTADGQREFESAENEIGEGRSPLSPVFHAAHDVITQLRLIDEARR
jgi:hypothetical protein